MFFFTTEVQGSLFEQLAICAKSISLRNSVTAHPPGIMAVHFNPAGLTKLEGKHFALGATPAQITRVTRFSADPDFGGFIGFEDEGDPIAGTEGRSIGGSIVIPGYGPIVMPVMVAPNMGISYSPPGSRWTIAVASYVPFGAGIAHSPDDPARFGGQELSIQRMVALAPTVAYEISDNLSVGLSMGFGPAAFSTKLPMRVPNQLVALTGMAGDFWKDCPDPCPFFPLFGGGLHPFEELASMEMFLEDNFTMSFNLGLLWEPVDWFALGICYQSESEAKMAGEFEFAYGQRFQNLVKWIDSCSILIEIARILGFPYIPMPGQRGRVVMETTFPQRAQFGIMLKPFKRLERLRLMIDLHYVNWSVWEGFTFQFDQPIQLLELASLLDPEVYPDRMTLGLNLKDTWHLSYGLEFQASDRLSIRLGYEDKSTSVPREYFGLLFFPDMTIYSVGFEWAIDENRSIDFGFAHFDETTKLPNNTSRNFNYTGIDNFIYNPYAGLDFEQELTANIFSINFNYKW